MKTVTRFAYSFCTIVGLALVSTQAKAENICYQVCVQGQWGPQICDGSMAGTTGQGLPLQAIKIWMQSGARVAYRAHLSYYGWYENHSGTGYYGDPTIGTCGSSRIEAIEAFSPDLEKTKSLDYWGHVQNLGDQQWKFDGGLQGTTGRGLQLEAIKMRISTRRVCTDTSWSFIKNGWYNLSLPVTGFDSNNNPICDGNGSYNLNVDGSGQMYRISSITAALNGPNVILYMVATDAGATTGYPVTATIDRYNNIVSLVQKLDASHTINWGSATANRDWNLQ